MPSVRNATVSSTNWSGYAVAATGVTEVRSTFVVPAVQAGSQGYASTWTGIGGYQTQDLIQAGFSEEKGGKYYAWVERLPAAAAPISGCVGDAACTVLPGDKPYVRIYKKSGLTWNVTIVNVGHGDRWTWTKDVFYSSRQRSAEWILEAPTVGGSQAALAHVGKVIFGPTSLYKAGGVLRSIAGGNPVRITLDQAGTRQATPSTLAADGQRFNDCSYAATCAAP
jgi:hypothetical protein